MKCPKCGNEDAQQLLVSFLCPNKKCKNYDVKQDIVATFKELGQKPNKIKSDADSYLEILQQALNTPKEEDPFDAAIKEYLKRKLQIDPIRPYDYEK